MCRSVEACKDRDTIDPRTEDNRPQDGHTRCYAANKFPLKIIVLRHKHNKQTTLAYRVASLRSYTFVANSVNPVFVSETDVRLHFNWGPLFEDGIGSCYKC